jgi:hypothetical protein
VPSRSKKRKVSKRIGSADSEEIIKEELIEELDLGMVFVRKRIRNLYGTSLMGRVFNPFASLFFSFFQEKKFHERMARQIEILLDVASCPDDEFEDVVMEHFDDYLTNEEIYARVNRKHPKFPKVLDILRDIYTSRVTFLSTLLRGGGDSYAEIVRKCYPNRKGVELLLGMQYRYMDKILDMLKTENGLFNIPPMIRSEVMLVLMDSYRYSKDKLSEKLDEIYARDEKCDSVKKKFSS